MNTESPESDVITRNAITLFQFVFSELRNDLRKEHLSHAHLELMLFIDQQVLPITMTATAKHCRNSTAACTGTIDRLEKLGFLERYFTADDRRKVFVRLTANGKEFLEKVSANLAKKLLPESKECMSLKKTLIALGAS